MSTRIAVIGSGISGLTAAYLLNRKCEVHVFEKETRLGGHTATIDVEFNGRQYAIDTGFIVYNDWTYPNFIKLLDQIGVANQPTSMGFSVSCKRTGLEYAGNDLNALFAQRRNIISPKFLRMLTDIMRFNREARRDLKDKRISRHMSLGDYLDNEGYSEEFSRFYLIPMGAAIWSASLAQMRRFPVHFFVQFFHNHGLLNIFNRPQWRVIKGGSKQYIEPLVESFKHNIHLGADILSVERGDNGVHLNFSDGSKQHFDQVVFACHSDQALGLLGDPSDTEQQVLGDIPYCENTVTLHYDETLLPQLQRTWSSWNYRLEDNDDSLPVVTYDMNILQEIDAPHTFCVSLNASDLISSSKVIGEFRYAHPQFSMKAIQAQQRWAEINGINNTWFCGAYWANGFHEDGVVSALRVAEQFGEFL